MNVSIWMGRGDPFAYWYTEAPLVFGIERKCTKEEAEELEELTKAVERRQELLKDISLRKGNI